MLVLDYGVVFNDPTYDYQRTGLPRNADGSQFYQWAQSPYPQFYRWEPELSQWGSHGYASGVWQASSSLSVAANGLFNWEPREVYDYSNDPGDPTIRSISGLLRGSMGVELQHNPDTSSYVEYRYLSASENEIIQAGVLYRIGRLYRLAASPQYDLRRGEFRAVSGSIRRKLPDFDLSLTIGYDLIRGDTTFGLNLSVPPQPGVGLPTY
jgi:hypothetical protein